MECIPALLANLRINDMGMFKTTLFEALQCADSWDVNGYCMYVMNIDGGVATLESDDDSYVFHDQEIEVDCGEVQVLTVNNVHVLVDFSVTRPLCEQDIIFDGGLT